MDRIEARQMTAARSRTLQEDAPPATGTSLPRPIRTIGHGTRATEQLAGLLRSAGVARVIDVRRSPAGRRQPHLSLERLAADLPALGVAYEWWGEAMGGLRHRAPGPSRHPAWRTPGYRAYAEHMDTPPFREALARLEELARGGEDVAIMCAETLWWRCHRQLIADALTLDGFEVRHLVDRPPGEPHRLNPAVRRDDDGRPVYDRLEAVPLWPEEGIESAFPAEAIQPGRP